MGLGIKLPNVPSPVAAGFKGAKLKKPKKFNLKPKIAMKPRLEHGGVNLKGFGGL